MDLTDNVMSYYSLDPNVARNLSNSTITAPTMEAITPRWLLSFLPWVSVEAGVYRLNQVKRRNYDSTMEVLENPEMLPRVTLDNLRERELPETFADYEDMPKEYILSAVKTILRMNSHVTDIFNSPLDQKEQEMRLTIEAMKERQELEVINNEKFGLLHCVSPRMRVASRYGIPTPDDMDELLTRVWKKPSFFLAHPRAIAAFGRECTRRGVPPVTVNLYGSPFLTWRGVPILPCDKLLIDGRTCNMSPAGKTNILLMRVGEREQGVIGLHQPGIPDEGMIPSLSVKYAGIDNKGIASYIMSLYFSAAVLADDALGMLENVEVGYYYDYT
ncbi:MAG: hypothetical protein K0R46_3306 [Herbinix sp.]|jgi:hypothetical protein|nr:hypothetical protein [Herbinix sp.]